MGVFFCLYTESDAEAQDADGVVPMALRCFLQIHDCKHTTRAALRGTLFSLLIEGIQTTCFCYSSEILLSVDCSCVYLITSLVWNRYTLLAIIDMFYN